MIEINPSRWKTKPFAHQIDGVKALVRNPFFALFDEMGSGKSKQVIDAACVLFEHREIDCVLIVAPASLRSVWIDKELGQIARHGWFPLGVIEYHEQTRIVWETESNGTGSQQRRLPFVVTNYEFIRPRKNNYNNLKKLKENLRRFNKIMLVLDESSAIKDRNSAQHEAVVELRERSKRCVELNGTPSSNSPMDLWGQMKVLSENILVREYRTYTNFRMEHCNCAPIPGQKYAYKILSYKNIEKIQDLIRPYCLRRLKKDCLDIPDKIGGIESADPIFREVQLTEASWKRYKKLRQEAIIALQGKNVLERNAAVRIIRLAQLTSGHISYNPENVEADLFAEDLLQDDAGQHNLFVAESQTEDVSHEKLDWTFNFLTDWDTAEATIVWCRFRRERERLAAMLRSAQLRVYELYGGQKKAERRAAEAAFDPSARGSGRRVLLAQPKAGGKGLQLHAATENVYQSNDDSLETRLQSEDRTHRSGTIQRVSYTDVLAVGPQGQKTIDWIKFKALRTKQDIATWTCSTWRKALEEE